MPRRTRVFFRERLKGILHECVFLEFHKREAARQLSMTLLAKRIDKDLGQVSKLLGSPGNWTLDTVSDLLLGMGLGLKVEVESLTDVPRVNVASEPGPPPRPPVAYHVAPVHVSLMSFSANMGTLLQQPVSFGFTMPASADAQSRSAPQGAVALKPRKAA